MLALAIDPGLENGACLFTFGQDQPFTVEKLWQFPLGAPGLSMWMDGVGLAVSRGRGIEPRMEIEGRRLDHLIVEKFTPRPSETFKLTQKAVEPLRGEGVIIGKGFNRFIEWAEPSQQYFMGSSELPLDVKKKLSREFLKLNDIYPTGKTVGRPNADDAISATLHSVAWLRRQRHMPTITALFGEKE